MTLYGVRFLQSQAYRHEFILSVVLDEFWVLFEDKIDEGVEEKGYGYLINLNHDRVTLVCEYRRSQIWIF